jgi:hypothetical protein
MVLVDEYGSQDLVVELPKVINAVPLLVKIVDVALSGA